MFTYKCILTILLWSGFLVNYILQPKPNSLKQLVYYSVYLFLLVTVLVLRRRFKKHIIYAIIALLLLAQFINLQATAGLIESSREAEMVREDLKYTETGVFLLVSELCISVTFLSPSILPLVLY